MNHEQLEAKATQVANTHDGLSAKRLLDELDPCDKESVLSEAVRIANDRAAKDPTSSGHYEIQVTDAGDQRVSNLVGVKPTFLGLGPDEILPVLTISVPKDCKVASQ